jgi:FAD/FMN-containing dehydrogenase
MSGDVLGSIAGIVGEAHCLSDPADKAPYLREWRDLYQGQALAVVRPRSTDEVARVVKLCGEAGIAIVPQGGNTGLVGGQIPMGERPAIVLSLTRMNCVRDVDADGDTMVVEAGVTLAAAQEAAEAAGRLFPLSLASEGSCTIGGTISTNAGGTAVLAYGTMRDLVLGLEVVLPDGQVLHGLRRLRKDNTGYDLRHLFIGAEGTLGIVTAAVLKLYPLPADRVTAWCGLDDPGSCLALFRRARATLGTGLTTFEFMSQFGLDCVLRHAPGSRDPLAGRHSWHVLVEVSGTDGATLRAALEDVLGAAMDRGEVQDAVLAESEDQRLALWDLRERLSEVQRFEGGSIKHDVSVPVPRVPDFIAAANAAVTGCVPGCRPLPFGHLGDGNVHYNVSQPVGADKAAFLARWTEVNSVVHGIAAGMDGSISAEHGIGRMKRDLLPGVKDPAALDLMHRIKQALDPQGLMNPGAVLGPRA